MKSLLPKLAKTKWILFLALILLSAFLRLRNLDRLTYFMYDQARDALYTKRLVVDHKLRLIGPQASPGFYTGPAYYYLMAPFLFISGLDPAGIDVGVAVFNIAAVALLYFLLRKITGSSWLSFLFSLLYSVQPQVVFQSRFSWNPNLTPFFTLFFLFGLFQVMEKKTLGWIVAAIALGFLIELHLAAVGLFPVFLLFIFLERKNKAIFNRHFVFSLAALVFMIFPFAAIELRHHFPNLRNLVKVVTRGFDTNLPPPPLVQGIWEKIQFLFVNLPFGVSSFLLSLVILAFTAAALWLAHRKKKITTKNWLVYSPVVFLVLLSLVYRGSFFQYYLTYLYPIPFLIWGGLMSSFVRSDRLRFLVYPLLGLFILISLYHLKTTTALYQREPGKENLRAVSEIIARDQPGRNFNIVGLRGGDRYDHNAVDYRYFLETFYGVRGRDWDVLDYREADTLYFVSNLGEVDPYEHGIWEMETFGVGELSHIWEVSPDIYVYKIVK